jgi:hypothetical protein
MTRIESKREPSSKERKALGVALCALGCVFALMIWFQPASLMLISCVSGLAWCAAMLFNKDEPLGQQWKGIMIPVIAGLAYAAVRYVASPATIAVAAAVALTVLGVVVWLHHSFGNRFYETWSLLFLPLAWSVSSLLLVLVYYGVLTPIGLVLRLVGRDPLHREFDRSAASYWVKRDEMAVDPDRYFCQF